MKVNNILPLRFAFAVSMMASAVVRAASTCSVDIYLQGAGYSTGGDTFLEIDGVPIYTSSSRGFTVTVLDELAENVLDGPTAFDTYGSAVYATDMLEYLECIPLGRFIVITSWDTANQNLDILSEEMEQWGAAEFSSIGFRESYAFFGSKHDPDGSVEVRNSSDSTPATISIQRDVDVKPNTNSLIAELETTLSTLIDERNAEVINALGLISETLDTVLRKVRQIDTAVEDLASA